MSPALELKSLANLLADGVFIDGDWVETKDQDPSGEVRLIQLADVGEGVFRDRSSRFLAMQKAKELRCTFLKPGDVLVARMPEPLGRACIFPGLDQPAVTVVDVCILRPNPSRARGDWLAYAINSPELRSSMQEFIRGTTRQRISRMNLGTLEVYVPELEAQAELASLLDETVLLRQRAKSHLEAAHKAMERFRQAVLAAACSGRLTADWREQNSEPTSVVPVLSELRSKRKERKQREQAVFLPLPELPETYVLASLGECTVTLEYGTSKKCVTDSTIGIPVLRMGNIQDGRLEFGDLKYCAVDDEIIRLMLEPGDLLFNRTNSPELVGKSAVYQSDMPASFASYVIRVRFDNRVALPEFMNYWLNSAWGRAWAQLAKTDGVSQSNINGSKLALMPVPLPPIDEQGVIVERASRMLMVADSIHRRVESASSAVDKSSQAVLAKAFRGQLAPAAAV